MEETQQWRQGDANPRLMFVCVCVCVQKQSVQAKPSAKDNQWYDVGIVKVTNMVVSHYYVPLDGNAIDVRATLRAVPLRPRTSC